MKKNAIIHTQNVQISCLTIHVKVLAIICTNKNVSKAHIMTFDPEQYTTICVRSL